MHCVTSEEQKKSFMNDNDELRIKSQFYNAKNI